MLCKLSFENRLGTSAGLGCLTDVISDDLSNSLVWCVLLLFSFYRWGKWDLGTLSSLPKVKSNWWEKWGVGYMRHLCILSYNCLWTYKYLKIKSLMFLKASNWQSRVSHVTLCDSNTYTFPVTPVLNWCQLVLSSDLFFCTLPTKIPSNFVGTLWKPDPLCSTVWFCLLSSRRPFAGSARSNRGADCGFGAKKEQSKGGKSQWAFCLTKDSGIGPSIDMQIEFCVICAFQ